MSLSDRLFAPPAPDAARIEARLAQLPARLRKLIRHAGDALADADLATAQRCLTDAMTTAPGQPDVLRLYALLLAQIGNWPAATANFEAALRAAPDDAMGYWQYARACEEAGDLATALRLRQRAVEHLPASPLAWADLGEHLFQYQSSEASLAPLERAVELAPDYAPGLFKLGSACIASGKTDEGVMWIRRALEREPAFGAAWMGLVDVKTVPVTDAEISRMREQLSGTEVDAAERTAMEFALAMACERVGRRDEAWQRLVDANARRQRELPPWDIERFVEQERRTEEVFSAPYAQAADSRLGEHAIFIAGMPRSGTTLVEQILASHPEVHGAGELGALPQVLTEESTRLRRRYPDWVTAASADDWQRLGRRYLEITAGFRKDRPWATDKLPTNWRALGAIRTMLPGARIVVCRRDPLENCWSCFKQYFQQGWEFTNDIEHLAVFWKAFDRTASWWAARAPGHIREQSYESLTENPETEIRALLEFCGLPFDPACLAFHQSRRNVHTLSAAQVRQPMRRHADTAAAYGALLDPLRQALGLPPWSGREDGGGPVAMPAAGS